MSSVQEQVFDNALLRHKILTKYVYSKWRSELEVKIKELLDEIIVIKWYLYCTCELCRAQRNAEYYHNLIGNDI